jgi:hypothetical protein
MTERWQREFIRRAFEIDPETGDFRLRLMVMVTPRRPWPSLPQVLAILRRRDMAGGMAGADDEAEPE